MEELEKIKEAFDACVKDAGGRNAGGRAGQTKEDQAISDIKKRGKDRRWGKRSISCGLV